MPTLATIRNKLGEFGDRFIDLARLGSGAEGGTWTAFDRDRDAAVVLKFVPKARVGQVARAFRVLRRVSSPHVPAALELLAAPDGAWLVTAFVPGNQLAAGPAPVADVLREAVAITHALRAIHTAGTHHGDVSMANVIRAPDGEVVLTDFGQLGCFGSGTPGFLAPEVLAGGGGPAADLFALGCLIHTRLVGRVPWRDPAIVARLDPQQVEQSVEKVAYEHQIPTSVAAVLMHLLAPNPERRMVDLGVLLTRLMRIQQFVRPADDQASIESVEVAWWVPARWPYRGASVAAVVEQLSGPTRPRLVVVAGPPGTGRGRVVEEIILGLQAARAAGQHTVEAAMCASERLARTLARDGQTHEKNPGLLASTLEPEPGDWLATWIHSQDRARVLGVDGELRFSGDLSADGKEPGRIQTMRAAVLIGAAQLARATLVVAVDQKFADTIKSAAQEVHDVLVFPLHPWGAETIADVVEEVLATGGFSRSALTTRGFSRRADAAKVGLREASGSATLQEQTRENHHGRDDEHEESKVRGEMLADARDDGLRGRWTRALHEVTQGWPARVVRGIEASARLGLTTPDLDVLAGGNLDVELDQTLAHTYLQAAWDGEGDSMGRYQRARALVGNQCRDWARAVLERRRGDGGRLELCLILDADDLEALEGWTCELVQRSVRERERIQLMAWLADGGLARLQAVTRTRLVEYFLRQGEAAWVLQYLNVDAIKCSPAEEVLLVRGLEQLGRAAEASTRISEIFARMDQTQTGERALRDTLHGLRWRAMTDCGQGKDVLPLVRVWSDGGPRPASTGVAEAWLWAGLAALMQGEETLAEQWLAHARTTIEAVLSTAADAEPSERRALGLLARVEQLEGNLAHARGQFHVASEAYRRACDAFVAAGEPGGQVFLWANLAGLALVSGDISRGVEAGRRALSGQLSRGRIQGLPAIVTNLVGLLTRVGAVDEAASQVELLGRLLAARGDYGKVAHARLAAAQAEVARARGVASSELFADAATALSDAGCTRESVHAWLTGAAVLRRKGELEASGNLYDRAQRVAGELDDHTCDLWLALERLAWTTRAGERDLFVQTCENLRLLTRSSELVHSGRLVLAFAYDRAMLLALHRFFGARHPRTRAAARRAHATLEAMMKPVDPIDQKAVRAHQYQESEEPEVLAELLAEAEHAQPDDATSKTGPTRRQSSRHERLIRIYRRLAREDELERLLVQVVDAMMELSDAERGVVVVSAPSAPAGERIQVARELAPGSEGVVFSRSVIERVLQDGQPILSVDAAEDDRFDGSRSVSHLNLRSVLAVPLLFRGEVLGAAYVDHRLRRGAFDETDLAHIEEFAELAALAVAHARNIAAQRKQAAALEQQGKELARLLEERENEVRGLREEMRDSRVAERKIYRGMVGASPAMQEVFRLIDRLANSNISVVVYGESGTGKELVSRAIHDAGERRNQPFVAENCGAIPESLLESVLFGHARGAFTGAHRASAGLFEAADGGTIFLDEIGEMSPAMQTKLLRVLQEGVVRRVGETSAREIDVRVIAASNRNLEQMVKDGGFRQDLFYRIQVVKIALPPLRMRTQDLAPLIAHFLGRHDPNQQLTVSAAAMRSLARYPWPGNIRELENEVQRWVVLAQGRVEPADLSLHIQGSGDENGLDPDDLSLKPRVERLERDLITRALARCGGNQTRAAELLGLSRYGLQKKIRRYEG